MRCKAPALVAGEGCSGQPSASKDPVQSLRCRSRKVAGTLGVKQVTHFSEMRHRTRLKHQAALEDIDYRRPWDLDGQTADPEPGVLPMDP